MTAARQVAPAEDSHLTAKQWRAVGALAIGSTEEQAARAADVAPSTLRRWKQQPAFRPAVERMSRELAQATADRLQFGAKIAVDQLARIAGNPNSKDEHRIRACEALLAKVETVSAGEAHHGQHGAGHGAQVHLLAVTDELVLSIERQRFELETQRQDRLARFAADRVIAGELVAAPVEDDDGTAEALSS